MRAESRCESTCVHQHQQRAADTDAGPVPCACVLCLLYSSVCLETSHSVACFTPHLEILDAVTQAERNAGHLRASSAAELRPLLIAAPVYSNMYRGVSI